MRQKGRAGCGGRAIKNLPRFRIISLSLIFCGMERGPCRRSGLPYDLSLFDYSYD